MQMFHSLIDVSFVPWARAYVSATKSGSRVNRELGMAGSNHVSLHTFHQGAMAARHGQRLRCGSAICLNDDRAVHG